MDFLKYSLFQYKYHFRLECDCIYLPLLRIKKLSQKHDVYLVCFCAPKSCHGDVIKEIIEKDIDLEVDFENKTI